MTTPSIAAAPTRRLLLGGAAALTLGGPSRARDRAERWREAARWSADRRGVSLLILEGGRTVFEDYARSGPGDAHELASGTKSFCGVLAAAMAQDGLLSIDERCAETLTEWRGRPVKGEATIRTLLTLSSGIGGGPIARPPRYAAAVAQPPAGEAGVFRYGPTPFQVFGEIVRRKLGAAGRADDVLAFLKARVLDPAGVAFGAWRRQAGQPNMPSGAQLTARDWGRFGVFVMGGGVVDGRRIVDPVTLAACFEPTAANPGYGLSWWMLRPGLVAPGPRSGVDTDLGLIAGRPDVRMAAGAGNQRLYLIPERDLVVVRQADGVLAALRGDDAGWSDAAFLRMILG